MSCSSNPCSPTGIPAEGGGCNTCRGDTEPFCYKGHWGCYPIVGSSLPNFKMTGTQWVLFFLILAVIAYIVYRLS